MADISSITLPNGQSYNIKDGGAIQEPASDGINGQVLTTDGSGGRTWKFYQESDPVFSYSPAALVTLNHITNWNEKVDAPTPHTDFTPGQFLKIVSYTPAEDRDLTSFPKWTTEWASESDPIFSASPAYGIASSDITNWNNKINEPTSDGTNGQVLTTDGSSNRSWTSVPKGSSANNIQIPISAWGGSTSCSLQVTGKYIVPTSTIIVCPEDYYREAWDLFEIECTSCSDDVLYFSCSTIPDLAIYFKVIVLNV